MMAIHRRKRQARRAVPNKKTKQSTHSLAGVWLVAGILMGVLGVSGLYLLAHSKFSFPSFKSNLQTKEKKQNKKILNQHEKEVAETERFEFYHILPGMEVPIPEVSHMDTQAAVGITELVPPDQKTKSPLKSSPLKASLVKAPSNIPNTSKPILSKPTPSASLPDKVQPFKPIVQKPKLLNQSLPQTYKRIAAAQYLIQIAAFREMEKATDLKTRLIMRGFAPHIQKVSTEDGLWFRVTLGPFPNESQALIQKKRLANHNLQGILVLQR